MDLMGCLSVVNLAHFTPSGFLGVLQIALINLGVRTNDFLVLIFYLEFGKVDSILDKLKERQNSDKEPGQIHKNGVFGNKFILGYAVFYSSLYSL